MENKRYKPLVDRLFFLILIPTVALLAVATVFSVFSLGALLIMLATDVFVLYFFVSSIFGYVELRENTVFIRFGIILKREIPYSKIRGVAKERKIYSESMLSLKNAMEHINIKYNSFDTVTVSVRENDELLRELQARLANLK